MYKNKVIKGFLTSIITVALSQPVFATENNATKISADKTQKSKKKKSKIQKHTFSGHTDIGFGYDSNPYFTPSDPYIDYTRTGAGATIQPNIKSGFFTPFNLKANYEYRLKKDIRLLSDIKLNGKYFYGSELKNANQYETLIQAGARFRFNKYKKEINKIEIKALAGKVYKIYVDHDDGTLKTTAGGDQSNRYKYKKVGIEVAYMYDFKRLDFLFKTTYENRDYEEPETWSSLDHIYTKVKTQVGYQYNKISHFGTYYQYSIRDYRERKAYEIAANGTISLSIPGVTYTYNDIKLFMSYKFSKSYKINLEYLSSIRKDDHQGYSNYIYNSVTWLNDYKVSKSLKTYLKLKYYTYNYPNAYAYDTSTSLDKKESSGYKVDLNARYKISSKLSTVLHLHYRQEKSTDKRYEYDQIISMALVKYKL
jgi:hypothetical protein